jgi:hypothetical protein
VPEQSVTAKAALIIEREGFVAARREFREAGKVIEHSRRPLTKYGEQLERIQRLQRRGILTRGQAFDARLQAAGQQTLAVAPGLARLINPFTVAAGAMTGAVLALRRELAGRLGRRDTTRAAGLFGRAADVGIDRIRGHLRDHGLSESAVQRITQRILQRAFDQRRTDVDRFATEQYQMLDGVRDPIARARLAEQLLGGRELGDPRRNFDFTIPQPGEGGGGVGGSRPVLDRISRILGGAYDAVRGDEPAGDP